MVLQVVPRTVIIPLVWLLSCGVLSDRRAGDVLRSGEWILLNGERIGGIELLGTTATVLVTLDPECPFCQMYLPLLDSLVALPGYGAVRFVGVFASPYIPRDSAAKFMRASPAMFNGIMDPEFVLCKALGARVTPEVFVLDGEGSMVYHGAIDDRAVRAGQKRIQATEHYLSDAINAVLRGERPADREVTAVGCILEYDR